MMKNKLILLLALFTIFLSVKAQEDSLQQNRYVMHSRMFGVGSTNILDTYLSPLEYKGTNINMLRENMRFTKIMGGKVSAQNMLQMNFSYSNNRAETSSEITYMMKWTYALHYQLKFGNDLKILFGPMADVNGGFVYNTGNSNNPAQAKAYANIDASGMIIYKFRLFNYPIIARYQANVPLIGLMFSPDYGESYYQMFSLHNFSGKNIVFTSLHNQPSLMQLLTLDFPIRKSNIRVGYFMNIDQAKVNGLKSHIWNHSFMVGIVKNFYLLKGKNKVSMPNNVTPY